MVTDEAIKIYVELCDMDYRDYEYTREEDIRHIQSVIDQYGAMAALDKLMAYFE